MSNRPLDYQLNTALVESRFSFSRLLIDPTLVICLLILSIFGVFVLYSASGQSSSMILKQSIYILIGFVLMFFVSRLDQSIYKSFLIHFFWIGLILLCWVLVFPAKGYNTDRWIDLGFITFQPSETLRLILPLAASSYLTRNQSKRSIKDWIIVIFLTFLCGFLIFRQPDLDLALIVLSSGFIPVFLAGFPIYMILILRHEQSNLLFFFVELIKYLNLI